MNTRSLSFRLVARRAGLLTVVFVVLAALTILFLRRSLEAEGDNASLFRIRQSLLNAHS